jgi:hypothetical protein
MLKKFKISPQFVPLLFAEPDYWSPGDFSSHDLEGSLQQLGNKLRNHFLGAN